MKTPVVLTALLMLPFTATAAPPEPDWNAIYERLLPVALVIEGTRDGGRVNVQGSGCVFERPDLVITAAHQVDGVEGLKARNHAGEVFQLEPLATIERQDVAILRADRPVATPPVLAVPAPLEDDTPLLTIGAPGDEPFTRSQGVVTEPLRLLRDYPVIQARLNVAPGSSGGPVFDREGSLLGIVTGRLNDTNEAIIAVLDDADAMLEIAGVPHAPPAEAIESPEWRAAEGSRAFNRGIRALTPEAKAREYLRSTELNPEFFEAWFNLGVAYDNMKERGKAVAAYERGVALRPDSAVCWQCLGRSRMAIGDPGAALEAFEQAAELAPLDARSYNDTGVALMQLNRFGEAQERFEQALRLDANHASARYNLGLALEAQGRRADAEQQFRTYLQRYPWGPDAEAARVRLGAMKQAE
ncbi:MAG: tetratricopeptide repeat protein [Candidatus Hydrogenedens sp.]|nr:tetratricopeptide repeat protein [Candidatus Hydrogenedens sp.]